MTSHEKQLPEAMMVCSSPQATHTALSSRSQNFPGTLSLNLHLPNVNTAPVSDNKTCQSSQQGDKFQTFMTNF